MFSKSRKLSRLIDRFFIKKPRFRRLITKLIDGEKTVAVRLLGVNIEIDTLREHGYLRASRLVAHSPLLRDELPVMVSLASIVGEQCTFVDIGANVGIYSAVMSRFKKLYAGFDVIAFEVNPDTFRRLARNANTHNFRAINVGIGSTSEVVDFVGGAVSHVTTRLDCANSYHIAGECFSAGVKALSEFDILNDLVIKIDVEGQEHDVLQGSRVYFEQKRVRCVYLDGYSDRACWEFLNGYGFVLLDGRTLGPAKRSTFSLLALRPS
jgi:FkbM family methyltransferase